VLQYRLSIKGRPHIEYPSPWSPSGAASLVSIVTATAILSNAVIGEGLCSERLTCAPVTKTLSQTFGNAEASPRM